MEEILKNLEKQSRQQLLFTKIICFLCASLLICTLILMIFIASAVQQVIVYAEPFMELIAKAESTLSGLDAIDLDSMNQAIAHLSEAAKSLTNLFSFF